MDLLFFWLVTGKILIFGTMPIRITTLLLCLIAFVPCLGLAQSTVSISGTWMGTLYQDEQAPFNEYSLRFELKQEGPRVVGLTHIALKAKPEYHAKMKLEGRWDKGVFSFHELEMMEAEHATGWGWCLKAGDLKLTQEGQYRRLSGPWHGYMDDFPCNPGTLTVERLNPQQAKPSEPKPVVVEEKPAEPTGDFGVVEGRKITHRKEVPVAHEAFTIYVWDGDKVDGDIISLQYNGQWLLRKFPISKTKKALRIEIEPGKENQLVLYAENEGQFPPNTAAITFFDGKQERSLNLSSDKATCGALKFVVMK